MLGMWLADGLETRDIVFFGIFFIAELVLAFGRQAWLLLEHDRAVAPSARCGPRPCAAMRSSRP